MGRQRRRRYQPEVSIEESLRERFDIQIGDEMRFDVLGRIVSARVTSFREVDFRDFRAGGFMIVFRPGPFDNAPHSFIAAVKGGTDTPARTRLQGLIVASYPNISVIDLREVLDTVKTIVDNVTLAVTVVGALVLLSGSLILIGAVSMTKFRRVYEAAILKTLGASSRLIATMLLLEYGVLGAIAGTVGARRCHRPQLGGGALRARSAVGTRAAPDDRGHRRDRECRRGDRRARQSRCSAAQAALDAPRGVGVQSPLVLGDQRPPGEPHSMDVAIYRDALLKKRGELLAGSAAKPLQWTMENNSGRQGDMADQAAGNNEVHIQLKLKQTDAKILQAIEGALASHRRGLLSASAANAASQSPKRD